MKKGKNNDSVKIARLELFNTLVKLAITAMGLLQAILNYQEIVRLFK